MFLLLNTKREFMFSHFFVFLVALLTPLLPAVFTTGILITVDFVTGIWASKRKNDPITSARLRDTVDKILIYNMTILLSFLVEKYMISEAIPLLRVALGFIAISEFKSISENIERISGVNPYTKIIKYLKKKHDL